jgi:hypothetical protein
MAFLVFTRFIRFRFIRFIVEELNAKNCDHIKESKIEIERFEQMSKMR